jgi:hypothetical protein
MWRLGQFIRQANHFGKPTVGLEASHHFAATSAEPGKHCFRRRDNSPVKQESKMKTITKEFQVPAATALMFACLSVVSTIATAVMPLVVSA